MKVMSVKHATYEQLEKFLAKNKSLDQQLLVNKGFVVELNGEIEASFTLEEVEPNRFWLKQLYITQSHAAKLPILLETILQIAKKKGAQAVYVHSHQPVVDILLEALEFKLEKNKQEIPSNLDIPGAWWSYHVS